LYKFTFDLVVKSKITVYQLEKRLSILFYKIKVNKDEVIG
jgi:hypothetical protein